MEEIVWLNSLVDIMRKVLIFDIPVLVGDTCKYEKQGCLGLIVKDSETFILIDDLMLRYHYEAEVNCSRVAKFLVKNDDPILKVLCHELAHLTHWNHTKAHAKLTDKYYKSALALIENVSI
jgi:hypothetical protein